VPVEEEGRTVPFVGVAVLLESSAPPLLLLLGVRVAVLLLSGAVEESLVLDGAAVLLESAVLELTVLLC
jgi:hypothetical protein